ncbi:MAG: hypothetical protein OXD54_16280 [Candidatus Poribacteria bacterium]|nr:hypothetical protein [Candidatus Poribacteria bacterium]
MTITYDFIAFSGRIAENKWTIGMKAIQGEVPLDIVIPNLHTSNSEDEDIIGVLTREGISRESTDVMELYRYLRQLNPKTNKAFGYNEVAIRNIHTHLNSLQIDQELRVQITYTERKESYIPASYNIKLLGTTKILQEDSQVPVTDIPEQTEITETPVSETDTTQEIPNESEKSIIPKNFSTTDTEIPVYKTTNTLEKLITFTRTLQSELKETTENLAIMVERVQLLEEERQRIQEQDKLLQDIFDQLNLLNNFEKRIHSLETDRHRFDKLQQTIVTYFKTSTRQTQALLKEVGDESDDFNPDN